MTSPNPNPDPTPNPDPKPNPVTTPETQSAIDAAAAAARRDGVKAGKKEAEDAAAQAKKDADTAAELDRKTKAGEFDAVKATIEKDRDDWKTRAETAEAWKATREEADGKRADELVKKLPESLTPLYPATLPLADRIDWLEKAVATADTNPANPPPGNPPSPKPGGPGKAPTVESVRDEMRRNRGLQPLGVRST